MIKNPDSFCNGCSLCSMMCSQQAIKMTVDNEGFLTPSVNQSLCNNCGVCDQICPPLNISSDQSGVLEKKVYACQAKNKQLLIEATAGAFFPILASEVLSNGGIVFGAAYDSQMRVIHRSADKISDLCAFNGSKYIQSDISSAIKEARAALLSGKTLFFSGTPCQIDAVKKVCDGVKTGQLITLDVVCYGVPSPALFRAYLDTLECKKEAKVIDFRFRDKHQFGWSHTTVIKYQDRKGQVFAETEPDYSKIPYYKMFGSRDCYRKACYRCKYNTIDRCSDITTGNFWGIERISKAFDHELGVSMVICNTERGKRLFDAISDKVIYEERCIEDAIQANDALVRGSVLSNRRDKIYKCFNQKGFEAMYKRFYTDSNWSRTRVKLSQTKKK